MPMPKTIKLILKGKIPDHPETYDHPEMESVEIKKEKNRVVPSKKNQQRITLFKKTCPDGSIEVTPALRPSEQHDQWAKDVRAEFKAFADHISTKHNISLPIYRAKIKVLFYFSNSMEKDLSNKFETIADQLHAHGILASDDFRILKPITLDGWVQRADPRTEIYISILDAQTNEREYSWDLTPSSHSKGLKDLRNLRKKLLRKGYTKRKT